MNANEITIDKFLAAFFAPDERVCLRVFDDKKRGAFKGAKLETRIDKIDKLEPTLRKHNDKGRGIYFVINHGGHEDVDISRVNAQFVECDELSIDEQMKQIDAFALPPSVIVKTQKSLHCYWLVDNAKVADFRRVQKRLIK